MTTTDNSTTSPAGILVVDDDRTLRDLLEYNLRREGYRVLTAAAGDEAVRLAYAERPDLLILDIMLPGMSGLDVCRAIRRELTMPILMLSAREGEIDKVVGLELGADDYLTKPFGLRELLARVRAMLRRSEMLAARTLPPQVQEAASGSDGGIVVNLPERLVTRDGQQVDLKPKEFDLLAFLAAHPQQVFSREVLLDRVWGYDYVGGTRTVDVHVRWLRSKLERDAAHPEVLQTVYGVGYKLARPLEVKGAANGGIA